MSLYNKKIRKRSIPNSNFTKYTLSSYLDMILYSLYSNGTTYVIQKATVYMVQIRKIINFVKSVCLLWKDLDNSI